MKKFITVFIIVYSFVITFGAYNSIAQWVKVSDGMITNNIIYNFAIQGNNLFTCTATGVYLTTNNGDNWISTNSGLPSTNILSLAISGNDMYAGCLLGIYKSTNQGQNWIQVVSGVRAFYLTINYYNRIFAGTDNNGVYVSSNNGINWVQSNSGITDLNIKCMSNHSHTFAGTQSGIFYSYDGGVGWGTYNYNLTNLNITALSSQGSQTLYAGTNLAGIFRYMGGSVHWEQVNNGLNSLSIRTIKATNQYVLAGTNNSVCLSTNYGLNWTVKNEGFPTGYGINSFEAFNGYIFAGTYYQSVWRRLQTELVTGIIEINNEIPSDYSLQQNYPNPFNPSTKIRFDVMRSPTGTIGDDNFVVIKVYDVQGREVRTLVNERLGAGSYEVDFDGSGLNNGVYFYQMRAGDFSETKRMILLK